MTYPGLIKFNDIIIFNNLFDAQHSKILMIMNVYNGLNCYPIIVNLVHTRNQIQNTSYCIQI